MDFRTAPTKIPDIRQFLIDKLIESYERKYREQFKDKFKDLGLEKLDPNIKDLVKLFTVLKILGYTLSLVIDNVDQHYPLSPEIQHEVFLEAQFLTDTLKTITIMSLREESFFRSRLVGVFDAYYIRKFHILSPNFLDVVENRIDYLLEILDLQEEEIRQKVRTRRSLEGKIEDLKMFFRIIRDSLKTPGGKRKLVSGFIENIAGGDMRRALELFDIFLVSGNTKVYEMLERYRETGFYQIAYHQLIKSIN